jgi:hypothetical protein
LNVKRALRSKPAIPAYVLVAALVAYVVVDYVQYQRQAGIYRTVYAGTVIKTQRTFMAYLSIAEGCASCCADVNSRRGGYRSSRSANDASSSGSWVAKIQTEDGRMMEVAISHRDYQRVLPGQYVISRNGNPRFYLTRAAAFKAVGAKE